MKYDIHMIGTDEWQDNPEKNEAYSYCCCCRRCIKNSFVQISAVRTFLSVYNSILLNPLLLNKDFLKLHLLELAKQNTLATVFNMISLFFPSEYL